MFEHIVFDLILASSVNYQKKLFGSYLIPNIHLIIYLGHPCGMQHQALQDRSNFHPVRLIQTHAQHGPPLRQQLLHQSLPDQLGRWARMSSLVWLNDQHQGRLHRVPIVGEPTPISCKHQLSLGVIMLE